MLDLHLALVGGLAVVLGLTSRRLRELPLSEPLLALAVGVVVGPAVLGIVALPAERVDEALELSARIVLAVSLMAVALRFPTRDVKAERRALALDLTVVLVAMAAITAGLGALLLGLPLGGALLLGATLAPTDPVLSSSIVAGEQAERTIPERVRLLLSVESGANDGLAFASSASASRWSVAARSTGSWESSACSSPASPSTRRSRAATGPRSGRCRRRSTSSSSSPCS